MYKLIGFFLRAFILTPFLIYARIKYSSLSNFTDYSIDIVAITLENAFFICLFSLPLGRVICMLSPIVIFLHSWMVATDTTMFSYVGSPLTLDFLKIFLSNDSVESSSEHMVGLRNLSITLIWEVIVVYGWRAYEHVKSKKHNCTTIEGDNGNHAINIGVMKIQAKKNGN